MEYKKITYEEAVDIVDGATKNGGFRRLFVLDMSCLGTALVYKERRGFYVPGYGEDELLLSDSAARACSWWVGVGDGECVLEARDAEGSVEWSGSILARPGSVDSVIAILDLDNEK